MNGLSKQKMYHVEWYIARMGEDQLQQIRRHIDTRISEIHNKKFLEGVKKFEEYEVKKNDIL